MNGLTPKQIKEIEALEKRYQDRIDNQKDSIDRLVAVRKSLTSKVQELEEMLRDYGHGERRHVVKFTETGFAIQHPLHERKDGLLLDCDFHQRLGDTIRFPMPGLYYASEGPDQGDGLPNWVLEEVDV